MPKEMVMEAETQAKWLREIATKLHDLCQPLTAMQCRLEISVMDGGDEAGMRTAIEEALRECERLNEGVHAMQLTVRQAMKAEAQEPK